MGRGGRRGESRPHRAAATLGAEGGVDRSGSHCLPQAPACGSQASPRSSHRPSPGGRPLRGPGVMGEEVAPHTPSPDSRRPSASSNCQPAHASAAPPLGSAPGGALSACLPLGFWRAAWDAGQAGGGGGRGSGSLCAVCPPCRLSVLCRSGAPFPDPLQRSRASGRAGARPTGKSP